MAKYGFFTTRCVEADGPDAAGVQAIKLVRASHALKPLVRNDREDEPLLYVEEVSLVEPFSDLPQSLHGFSWYAEDE